MINIFNVFRRKYSVNMDKQNSDKYISHDIDKNVEYIKYKFGNTSDLIIKHIMLGTLAQTRICILFLDGISDKDFIQSKLIKNLKSPIDKNVNKYELVKYIKDELLTTVEVKKTDCLELIVDSICEGDAVIFISDSRDALILGNKQSVNRNVEEPESESVMEGPKDGFIEVLNINQALLRKRLKTPDLRFESFKVGRSIKNNIAIAYIKNIADSSLIEEVKDRISKIDIDCLIDMGYIQEIITDNPFSIFPTTISSERPDVVCSKLLEGRVAILLDGSPRVMTVPTIISEFLSAPSDYYTNYFFAMAVRPLRYLAFFISLFAPALYVAAMNYHIESLPPELIVVIAAAQEQTPFPIAVELLLMMMIFELLREASVRMAGQFGQTITIVGALVLGQAAIAAKIAGPSTIVVVSTTAIALFAIPSKEFINSLILLRFAYMFAAVFLGFAGLAFAIALTVVYLCSLRSFGVPYMSPFAPADISSQKDLLFRAPWWAMMSRPGVVTNSKRQDDTIKNQILKDEIRSDDDE